MTLFFLRSDRERRGAENGKNAFSNFIFYSIPESIVLISLSSALYGYDVKANFRRIIVLGVCLAVTTYIVRALPIQMGLNIIIQFPVFVFLTSYFLKITFKPSLIIIFTGYVIIILTEIIVYPSMVRVLGMDPKSLFTDVWIRLIGSWSVLLLLTFLALIVIKKGIYFASTIQFFRSTTLNTKIGSMIFIVLIQAFLAGLLYLISFYDKYIIWPVFVKGELLQKLIGFALITIPLISVFFLKRLFFLNEQDAKISSLESYIRTVNDLFLAAKSQRHDFINHIQVITGLLQLNKKEEALQYGLGLAKEGRETSEALNIDNPAVAALVKAKYSMAIASNIRFRVNFQANTGKLEIKPYELVGILGNLLDNAIYAASQGDETLRRVYFNAREEEGHTILEVMNLGPVIPPDTLNHIFDDGFPTKSDGHSGTGLAVVKKLVSQYKGSMTVMSTPEKGTIFTITLPCKQ